MSNDIEPVTRRLDILIRLFAASLVTGKNQREQIELLSNSGLTPKEIAELVGTTPNTVRVALSAIRKKQKKKSKST